MATSFIVTIVISVIISAVFIGFQFKFFKETKEYRELFQNFFGRKQPYAIYQRTVGNEGIPQLEQVGYDESDLNNLIKEINHYIYKTKGTTDFATIQNKVERKLNMRYDQSTARLAFPTYLGLMGTFLGVFMGILMFVFGFDDAGNVSDASIKNLMIGVLVSMFTSLTGLLLTTINNGLAGGARKKIEEDKNEFYDFVQTEVMPSVDVSMVSAITKLHETVDKFEPAFDRVIQRFQTTFDTCTKAFGDNFERHVVAVSGAVEVMGRNMDKINDNISLQEKLLSTLKSGELVRGMDKYIEAANHFVSITQSLNKFEEARRMMLAAAQEAITLQNNYSESLKVPKEIAIRVNQILDRIKDFEKSVNEAGQALTRRDILGNDVIESIQRQVQGISKKGKIADKFLEMADGKLEDMYRAQTKVLEEMNRRYKDAIEGHIEGFEAMIKSQTDELERRHNEFIAAIEEKFNIESIREEFTNLRKLELIEKKLGEILNSSVKPDAVHKEVEDLQKEIQRQIQTIRTELEAIKENTKDSGSGGGLFGWGRK